MKLKIFSCLVYLAVLGISSFLIGRLLAKKCRFHPGQFPFRCCPGEAQFYVLIRVGKWQNKLPDMSKILPRAMPAKQLSFDKSNDLDRMVQETCVAEVIHFWLCVLGFGCAFVWRSGGGVIIGAVYCVANIPFLLVQRYNRPRLLRLSKRLKTL